MPPETRVQEARDAFIALKTSLRGDLWPISQGGWAKAGHSGWVCALALVQIGFEKSVRPCLQSPAPWPPNELSATFRSKGWPAGGAFCGRSYGGQRGGSTSLER